MLKQLPNAIFLLTCLVVSTAGLRGDEARPLADEWQASWIGVDIESSPNQWTCFRKVVDLDTLPRQARARIAVDSKYWLWINGNLVVFEGNLKRGPTPQDTYHDTVDLTGYLEKGANTIAILVWHFGKEGYSHHSSGRSGLVFEATIDGQKLLSDGQWKVRLHPAYGDTGEPHPNFRLPESNICFDARKDIVGWHMPGFDDSKWPAATVFGRPPCAPWNHLEPRPIPMWRVSGLREYEAPSSFPEVSDGRTLELRLPYNAQVTPYLKIDAPAGQRIDIRTDNYAGGGRYNVRAEYITRDGVQEYESLGWVNGHSVLYTIPAGIRILDLRYRETGYDIEFSGMFECDDDLLNRLWQKALRTLYVNMRDTYFDCPDRERAQWWGDVVILLGQAFYALEPSSSLLAKKGILELIRWQRPDGTIYSPVPSGNYDNELPMQMLNSVGYFGFWTYYLHSGDIETIRTVYPGVKRYLSLWEIGDDGLVVPRSGGWTWGDWGPHKDMTALYNGWYYLALKGQLNMALAVGAHEDVPGVRAKMAQIKANFNTTFWNGQAYRSPGYRGETDDRAQALAVVSGLADPDKFGAIREVLRTAYHSSPYMEKFVVEALYRMRFADDAIARTKMRFREMTEHESTTLWEYWRIGGSRPGGTINHAWSGGALTLLSQYGAGVAPVEPGYATYHVLPQMGPLKMIRTTVPSVRGDIRLELLKEKDAFSLQLTSPEATKAIVGIPLDQKTIERIEANGRCIWGKGREEEPLAGLRFLEASEHYIKFVVEPGKWSFKASYQSEEGRP